MHIQEFKTIIKPVFPNEENLNRVMKFMETYDRAKNALVLLENFSDAEKFILGFVLGQRFEFEFLKSEGFLDY